MNRCADILSSWRIAFSLDRVAGAGCEVTLRASAAAGGFAADTVPVETIWPTVEFAVPLASEPESVACDRYALSGPSGVVSLGQVVGPHTFSAVFDGVTIRPPAL